MSETRYGPNPNRAEKMAREIALAKRFWIKVSKSSGCWTWMAGRDRAGYGRISDRGKNRLAHRIAYKFVKGPIHKRLTIDHLCRNRACVNPDHLEAVTMRVNVLRGVGACAKNARQTHCKRGHPFSIENTFILQREGRRERVCRECHRAQVARWHEAQRRKRA